MKRTIAVLLAILLSLSAAAGCGRKNSPKNETRTGTLTNVFRGREYPLPEGWNLSEAVPPVYDPETDTVRCLASLRMETENEDGTISFRLKQCIFLLAPDGPDETEEVPESFLCGPFADDGFWCLAEDYADRTRHVVLKHNDETAADLTDSLEGGGMYVRQLRVDDGGFLVLTEGAITAYTGEGTFRFAVNGLGSFVSLLRDGSGAYWAEGYYREGHGIVSVDLETRSVGAVLLLPQDVTGICEGADGSLYGMARDGICRLTIPESGEIGAQIRADFLNSSIDGPNAALLAAPDGDTFLLREYHKARESEYTAVPGLYRRAEDIDLSTITVLTRYDSRQRISRLSHR